MASPSSSTLWWRQLNTVAADVDTIADAEFLKVNFTDFFGQWLQQGDNAQSFSLDSLLTVFYNGSQETPPLYTVQIFMVADGDAITDKSQDNWFNPHARFLALIGPYSSTSVQVFGTSPGSWTVCIVGSNELTDTSERFLQVASWFDSEFRFYGREHPNREGNVAWIYQGKSSDAFDPKLAYLGPFNGHINGACIMKELHEPWLHWYSPSDTGIAECLNSTDIAAFKAAPYLTRPGSTVLQGANVVTADVLEIAIEKGVSNWFNKRRSNDFWNQGQPGLLPEPQNVPRWIAHLLLTTTVNIIGQRTSKNIVPIDHFIDNELLSNLTMYQNSPLLVIQPKLSYNQSDYEKVVEFLGLSLLQEIDPTSENKPPADLWKKLPVGTMGGGKQTNEHDFVKFALVQEGEGQSQFNILTSSHEDAIGVFYLQSILGGKAPVSFLTQATLYALLMVDIWNPIYSWRRAVLMAYLPPLVTCDGKTYDFETNFIATVRKSSFVTAPITDSPEYQFIQLIDNPPPVSTYQAQIKTYFGAVSKRLLTYDGLLDYMTLAECRRRIYRPVPLNEFGYTLPYALNYTGTKFMEMTAQGTIQPMPQRGQDFLTAWTNGLASFSPSLLPVFPTGTTDGPVVSKTLGTLPSPGNAVLCERATTSSVPSAKKCPFMTNRKTVMAVDSNAIASPTWNDDILPMISAPFWIPEASRAAVGSGWISSMSYWGPFDINDSSLVKSKAVLIYQVLRSKWMPMTDDPSEYWPEDALETFRSWANTGFRITSQDPVIVNILIPPPTDPPTKLRVRKDIRNLTASELQEFRSKLDDVLKVGILQSKWQELGNLHGNWCYHYQEAFVFWHRAYLLYVENLIDFPIPYWDGYAVDTADPQSEFAGIPSIFLESTYIHPSGEVRPNPLKYALAQDGRSAASPPGGPSIPYVTRDPTLVAGSKDSKWDAKINLFTLYHQQIGQALGQSSFSEPENITTSEGQPFGIPWANLGAFTDNQPDNLYPYRFNFDGLFEQVHDNYHGWIGPDMSINATTAFDPIFLAYHSNMDRIAAIYLETHPQQQFTSNFPLKPFTNNATNVAYDDPRQYIYTTLGDLAKDTMALGYAYGPTAGVDSVKFPSKLPTLKVKPAGTNGTAKPYLNGSNGCPNTASHGTTNGTSHVNGSQNGRPSKRTFSSSGGNPLSLVSFKKNKTTNGNGAKATGTPYIVFNDVMCTPESYQIDVFAPNSPSHVVDPATNPGFIGHIVRLGMGEGSVTTGGLKNRNRCDKTPVTRCLNAGKWAVELKAGKVDCVVTKLQTGEVVDESVWKEWKGFVPSVRWVLE